MLIFHFLVAIFLSLLPPSFTQSFFLTYHGGKSPAINNIGTYTVTGEWNNYLLKNDGGLRELRGIVQIDEDTFVFANAYVDNSTLYVTNCAGTRMDVFTRTILSHPYGITYNSVTRRVYVTNQDTNNVVVFSYDNPTTTASVFSQVNTPRGIAVDRDFDLVFVASETDGVIVFYGNGTKKQTIPVDDPIGVTVTDGYLYVSSWGTVAAVYSYVTSSGTKVMEYNTDKGMAHPCGLVVNEGVLYVLGQKDRDLLSFSVKNGTFLGSVINNMPDDPEQIIVASCVKK